MDKDKQFEKLAHVRMDHSFKRESALIHFRQAARVHMLGRYWTDVHMFASSKVSKKQYHMRKPENKRRFGTAKARDEWVIMTNRQRDDRCRKATEMLGSCFNRWMHETYPLLLKYLGRYGALGGLARRTRLFQAPKKPVLFKPIPAVTNTYRRSLLGGISVTPLCSHTGETKICGPVDLGGAKVPIYDAPNPVPFKFKPSQADVFRFDLRSVWKCQINFGDIAERLFIKTNLCLVSRSEEARGVPREVWLQIAAYARSPPFLVVLRTDNTILMPERQAYLHRDSDDPLIEPFDT